MALNGLDLGRGAQTHRWYANISQQIGNKMRKTAVKNVVLRRNKASVMIDPCININVKAVLVFCLKTAVL
jgi:hypothetical protein